MKESNEKILEFKISDSQIMCVEKDKCKEINEDIKNYIIRKSASDEIFNLYMKNAVYRCLVSFSDIICFDITDLVLKYRVCEKKIRGLQERLDNLGSLLDMLVHDMRNHLFLLNGFVETYENDEEWSINKIKQVIGDMNTLIRKISIFIASSDRLIKRKIRIGDMINDITNSLKSKSEKKYVHIIKKCRNITIYADPILKEALFNIIDNAITHTPEGTKVIVDCRIDGKYVIIKIADEGKGIPPEMRDLLFEKFKKGKDSVGMGLGLAIVKHVVDMLDGKVWVEENLPYGSIFCLRIPKK